MKPIGIRLYTGIYRMYYSLSLCLDSTIDEDNLLTNIVRSLSRIKTPTLTTRKVK